MTKESAITNELIEAPQRASSLSSVARLGWDDDSAVSLVGIDDSTFLGRRGVPLVEIFSADEQRARTSQAYVRSAIGARLRYVEHSERATESEASVCVTQRDPGTGLVVRSWITRPRTARVIRVRTTIENTSSTTIVLTAASTATFGFGASEDDLDEVLLAVAESEWLAENRWQEHPLRSWLPRLNLALHGQDGRGHHGMTSHGAWSTGEHLAAGIVTSVMTGEALGWQFETSGGWHCDLSQARDGGTISLLGPTDLHHQFAHELQPGETFETVPVAVATSSHGRDGVVAEFTRYRRWLRAAATDREQLPVIYNDFMNTLMGQPTTEALLPLIDAAAEAGAEYFCIDAGWFADPAIGDWWSTVGEWREASGRFTGGLAEVIDRIHRRGMKSGLWLEPEVVGVESPAAEFLPGDAFFTRFGRRVREHDRYHLDVRHPAARAHLDETVDHLVSAFGISYLKLDYNINPGVGTDWRAAAPGAGLLGHTRAFRTWLLDVQERHPHLLIENCSSGAMRADYSLLSVSHLQSTSDQQDFRLYPPIAASAPATILPEQCGNWAYPHLEMTDEETAFTLVTGLAGRLYLSGFLDTLRGSQFDLVRDAVRVHKELRDALGDLEPFWPMGLPGWDDSAICLGLRGPGASYLIVWDRSDDAAAITVPGVAGTVREVFPRSLAEWRTAPEGDGLRFETVPGLTARVFELGCGA